MKVTYYGHSCLSVEVGGQRLLFDPFISPNPLAKGVDLAKIEADYILLSHGHIDHVADAADLLHSTKATLIANYEICEWFGKKGISKARPMNFGVARFDFGKVRMVHALHSSVLPDGAYGGNPGGFVVETDHGSFYYSGDTALTMEMRLIGESTKLAFAALSLGGNFTMDVEDAVQAAQFVRCNTVVGMHYDTFPPIKIDHKEAARKFQAAGQTLHLVPIGDTVIL